MAVGRETFPKIFAEAIFGLILSIGAPACYLGKIKKFDTNASFVQKKISYIKGVGSTFKQGGGAEICVAIPPSGGGGALPPCYQKPSTLLPQLTSSVPCT